MRCKTKTHTASCAIASLLAIAAPFLSVQAANTPGERANKKVVLDFYAALDRADSRGNMAQQIRGIAEKYLRPDYIQHNEAFAQAGAGREGFIHLFANVPAAAPNPNFKMPIREAVMAEGDRVILVTSRQVPDPASGGRPHAIYIFNMFRIQDGRIAEHWDGSSIGGMLRVKPPQRSQASGPAPGPVAPAGAGQ